MQLGLRAQVRMPYGAPGATDDERWHNSIAVVFEKAHDIITTLMNGEYGEEPTAHFCSEVRHRYQERQKI